MNPLNDMQHLNQIFSSTPATSAENPPQQSPQQGLQGDQNTPSAPKASDPLASVPGYTEGMNAFKRQQQAYKDQADANVQALSTHMAQEKLLNDDANEREQNILNQVHDTAYDIANSHINPNQYMDSKSGLSKVSTALGLILGGISSGRNWSTQSCFTVS